MIKLKRSKIVISVVLLLAIFMANSLKADQESDPAKTEEEYKYEGKEKIYKEYALILKEYVDDQGMVDYAALKGNRAPLDTFVEALGDTDPEEFKSWNDKEKTAFWINAYNALTLQTIINHYPIKGRWYSFHPDNSIRQIDGVWDEIRHTVLNKKMTLDHIEHEILRKEFNEPQIHMALVCAAMGCPPLLNKPYVAGNLDQQFADRARKFLTNPEKFKIDRRKNRVYLSKIFDWFGEDFIKTYLPEKGFGRFKKAEKASLHYVSQHVKDSDAAYLRQDDYKISNLKYDWSLNEQQKKQ